MGMIATLSAQAQPYTLPLHYYNNSAFNNAYALDLNIGTPTQHVKALIDTGSSRLVLIGRSKICSDCTIKKTCGSTRGYNNFMANAERKVRQHLFAQQHHY